MERLLIKLSKYMYNLFLNFDFNVLLPEIRRMISETGSELGEISKSLTKALESIPVDTARDQVHESEIIIKKYAPYRYFKLKLDNRFEILITFLNLTDITLYWVCVLRYPSFLLYSRWGYLSDFVADNLGQTTQMNVAPGRLVLPS